MRIQHSKSIIQTEKTCFICGAVARLQRHHCLGGCLRQTAENEGLWVWLCTHHHTGQDGVHQTVNIAELKRLQALAQQVWLKQHNWDLEAWMKRFGKSFI